MVEQNEPSTVIAERVLLEETDCVCGEKITLGNIYPSFGSPKEKYIYLHENTINTI